MTHEQIINKMQQTIVTQKGLLERSEILLRKTMPSVGLMLAEDIDRYFADKEGVRFNEAAYDMSERHGEQ